VRVNLIHSTLVFQEKNIVYMTMRVNLIHSKLVFFLNVQKLNTPKKKLFMRTVQVNCTIGVHSASELHCARKR